MNYEVLCCSIWYEWVYNPTSHKICKNNAITMTVYKVPEVNILVKVKNIYIYKSMYFLSVCYILRWSPCQTNLTYLKSGTSQCSILHMYSFRFIVPECVLQSAMCVDTDMT